MTPDEERIARRYPKRSVGDYLIYGGLAVGIGVAMVLTVISAWHHSTPPVEAMVRSFTVDSPSQVTVELVVQRSDPSKPAQCKLIAQADSYEEVGETTVDVPAAGDKLKAYTFTVATVKEPVAVDQRGCTIAGG